MKKTHDLNLNLIKKRLQKFFKRDNYKVFKKNIKNLYINYEAFAKEKSIKY